MSISLIAILSLSLSLVLVIVESLVEVGQAKAKVWIEV
jgi:hypothetical protein